MEHSALDALLNKIRACDICAQHLPLGPRPVLSATQSSSLLIIGQAPGTKVHQSGIPWDDASGKRLRQWLQMDTETFYNTKYVGIVPMGFCYPGKGKSGDLPPRPECAETWHNVLMEHLQQVKLTLLIGTYAQKYYLGKRAKKTLTETVKSADQYLPHYIPLPHPSPRNQLWLKKNPWFEGEILALLRTTLRKLAIPTIGNRP